MDAGGFFVYPFRPLASSTSFPNFQTEDTA